MIECEECGMPQPFNESRTLHYDECSQHDIESCEACKELILEEIYEEMVIVKRKQRKYLEDYIVV